MSTGVNQDDELVDTLPERPSFAPDLPVLPLESMSPGDRLIIEISNRLLDVHEISIDTRARVGEIKDKLETVTASVASLGTVLDRLSDAVEDLSGQLDAHRRVTEEQTRVTAELTARIHAVESVQVGHG